VYLTTGLVPDSALEVGRFKEGPYGAGLEEEDKDGVVAFRSSESKTGKWISVVPIASWDGCQGPSELSGFDDAF
jgi:hypothetical protein